MGREREVGVRHGENEKAVTWQTSVQVWSGLGGFASKKPWRHACLDVLLFSLFFFFFCATGSLAEMAPAIPGRRDVTIPISNTSKLLRRSFFFFSYLFLFCRYHLFRHLRLIYFNDFCIKTFRNKWNLAGIFNKVRTLDVNESVCVCVCGVWQL